METAKTISDIAREIADKNGFEYDELKPAQKNTLHIKAIIEYLEMKESHDLGNVEVINMSGMTS